MNAQRMWNLEALQKKSLTLGDTLNRWGSRSFVGKHFKVSPSVQVLNSVDQSASFAGQSMNGQKAWNVETNKKMNSRGDFESAWGPWIAVKKDLKVWRKSTNIMIPSTSEKMHRIFYTNPLGTSSSSRLATGGHLIQRNPMFVKVADADPHTFKQFAGPLAQSLLDLVHATCNGVVIDWLFFYKKTKRRPGEVCRVPQPCRRSLVATLVAPCRLVFVVFMDATKPYKTPSESLKTFGVFCTTPLVFFFCFLISLGVL